MKNINEMNLEIRHLIKDLKKNKDSNYWNREKLNSLEKLIEKELNEHFVYYSLFLKSGVATLQMPFPYTKEDVSLLLENIDIMKRSL